MTGDNRERGILTPADRSYLRNETELASVQSERNTRARIRNRVYHAILDFELLIETLSDHDQELIFKKRFGAIDGTEAYDALVSAVAFLYQATEYTDLEFETVLNESINMAEAKDGRIATVEIAVTFQSLTTDQLRHKLKAGEELSLTEIAYLHKSDEIRMDELSQYFQDAEKASTEIDDGRIQSKMTNF